MNHPVLAARVTLAVVFAIVLVLVVGPCLPAGATTVKPSAPGADLLRARVGFSPGEPDHRAPLEVDPRMTAESAQAGYAAPNVETVAGKAFDVVDGCSGRGDDPQLETVAPPARRPWKPPKKAR